MKKNFKAILFLFVLTGIISCQTKIQEPKTTSGSADLSRFLSVGESFTSGYMDGALYLEGQQNSFPAILSKSFSFVTAQDFKQPLVNAGAGIGLDSNSKFILTTSTFCYGTSLAAVNVAATGDYANYTWIGNQGPFNNLGVPALRIFEINNQLLGNPNVGNSFYARFVKMQDNNHTLLSDMSEFNPTFFTLWMGIDDLFPYALSGGTNDNDSLVSQSFPATFGSYLETMIKTLTANKSKGVVANIPNILDFPFFTAIPYNGVFLSEADAATINAIIGSTYPQLHYQAGNNPYVIDDPSALNGLRFMTSNEFVLMNVPHDSLKCFHYGAYDMAAGKLISLPDRYVIDGAEAALITQRCFDINDKIHQLTTTYDLAYIDMYDYLRQVDKGIKLNGVNFSFEYLDGNTFSLDGLHPNAKGHALIANQFIKAINEKYGASLREADPNAYPGIKFP